MSAVSDILTHANVWLDGTNFMGEAESISLPKIKAKKQEYFAGGMAAAVEVPMAHFEKMEATFSMKTMNPAHLKLLGVTLREQINVTVLGSLHSNDGKQKPVRIAMRGIIADLDEGDWKSGEVATFKFILSVYYYRREQDGKLIYEIDPVNMVAVINGVDQLASTRAHLGS